MLPNDLKTIWVYLAASPLLGLTITLTAYLLGQALFVKSGMKALLHPVLIAVIALILFLKLSGTDYQTYFQGAQFVHFLLGPATVALAIPLYRQIHAIRRVIWPLLAALLAGCLTAISSAVLIAWSLGGSRQILLSLSTKSVTAPIAMAVAEQIGGLPSLTASLVIMTGIIGAVLGVMVLDRCKISDPRARGLALGVAAHGIGTARALQDSEIAGAFAGLAIGLNGGLTALLVPLLARLFDL